MFSKLAGSQKGCWRSGQGGVSMGTAAKGRRKIIVAGKMYRWDVSLDCDSPFHILIIVSEDKAMILSCPLKTEIPYIISKGKIFVSDVILWSTQSEKATEKKWDGRGIPV